MFLLLYWGGSMVSLALRLGKAETRVATIERIATAAAMAAVTRNALPSVAIQSFATRSYVSNVKITLDSKPLVEVLFQKHEKPRVHYATNTNSAQLDGQPQRLARDIARRIRKEGLYVFPVSVEPLRS
jgi:hypothetical protein